MRLPCHTEQDGYLYLTATFNSERLLCPMNVYSNDINVLMDNLCINSDEASYKKLFCLLFPRLKRFAYDFLRSKELAEEVASDIMFMVWENRDRLREISNISVYLMVAAKNRCINMLKQQHASKTIALSADDLNRPAKELNPEQIYIRSEMDSKIKNAVNLLPDRCKLIFKMVREEKMSYKEVSEILDISVKTVDAQLMMAMKKITATIKMQYPSEKYFSSL